MQPSGASALPRTLGALPAHAAGRWPARQALYFEGRTWTFGELAAEVDRAAAGLLALGVRPGDKVALWITNRPQFLFAFFGALHIGAVAVPLNVRWRSRDLLQALRHCEADVLVSETAAGPVDFHGMVCEALGEVRAQGHAVSSPNCPRLRRVVFLGDHALPGALGWDEMLARASQVSSQEVRQRAEAVDPDGLAMLVYTSGTTGTPKAVMLAHHGGIGPSVARAHTLAMTHESVQIVYLPIFHIYALVYAVLPSLLVGARQVLVHRFDAREVLRLIATQRGTILHGFDTHYQDLLAAYRAPGAKFDIGSLQWSTFSAGTDTARAVALEVQRTLCRTISTYGQSELWGAVTSGPSGCSIEQSSEASGMPLPGVKVRIVDPQTRGEVPLGEVGEILVRSPHSLIGYYGAEEATRTIRAPDGWVSTGDAGSMRADGHLRFQGRFKDMLKVGGENVDPAEIEALLLECPLVARTAVVGGPDERLAEVPVAYVVAAPGAQPDEIRAHIDALCRGKVASYKIPRRVEVIAEMPVNASGKVDKKVLRERLQSPARRSP